MMIGGMVLFWALIILVIVWFVRGPSAGWWGRSGSPTETPLEILQRRFAEGQISADEYHERQEALTGGAHPRRPSGEDERAVE
jgi:putative membrane protein